MAQVNKQQQTDRVCNPIFKKSLLALATLGYITAASGQEAAVATTNAEQQASQSQENEDELEVVEVKGMRSSLLNAQSLKRNADTFVDGLTATDIGALPDRSVLEAMQRLPGVSIERFAAPNDPDHFSAEGSGAVVRGMTQTRSEFNGRDTFTADSGRGLSFQDVPPELMGGVDVYKNQTADMIEGGIAGTISLRTRLPFDQQNRQLAFSADMTYGDLAKDTTPSFSAIYSDRWKTDNLGEFGFLLNVAKSELKTSSHGVNNDIFEFRTLDQFPNASSSYVFDGSFANYAPSDVEIGDEGVLVPTSANLSMKDDTRERTGIAAAVQWASPDDSLRATLQFIRSDSSLAWNEKGIGYESQANVYKAGAAPGTEFEFDDRGVFSSGTITDASGGWRGGDAEDRVPNEDVQNFGFRFSNGDRYKEQRTKVDDYNFKLEWTATDSLQLVADFQHVHATKVDDDMKLMLMTHANQIWDTSDGNPHLTLVNPWSFASEEEIAANGADYRGDSYFSDIESYHFAAAMDHYERSEGKSNAARLDGTYFLDNDHITQVKFGVRYAKRQQRVKNSAYNWGSLGALWAGTTFLDNPILGEIANTAGVDSVYETVDWGDFYRGSVLDIQGGNTMLHPSHALTKEYDNWGEIFRPLYEERCGDWRPMAQRIYDDEICTRKATSSHFLPQEVSDVSQENTAAYVRVDFENDNTEYRFSGNVGVRVVEVKNTSKGSTLYPTSLTQFPAPDDWDPNNFNPEDYDLFAENTQFLEQTVNYLPEQLRDFMNGAVVGENAENSFTKVLPSFNIKVSLTDDILTRFAVSKAIALPDIGALRNYTQISLLGNSAQADRLPAYWNAENPYRVGEGLPGDYQEVSENGVPLDENGEELEQNLLIDPSSVQVNGFRASGGNPFLKPMESVQWDLSLEWYFSDVGSLTASVFYKDLKNFFINGGQAREYTNPETGTTQLVDVEGPRNGGKGEMKGLELSYQQFFDMLPEPFNGLGTQINYTYINAEGVPNSNVDSAGGIGDSEDTLTSDSYALQDSVPLQGQSEHTANFIAMYEKSGWSARLAYNWRSEYLVTTRDTISKLPVWTGSNGYLDGSVFYDITDKIKIGLQGVNLLNTETRTFMQVDNDLKLSRAWLVNDRRYTFAIRGSF
ncbi:TonB-dependent receptor [Alteromonadaceae bacterium BrNp21-10]|nr:TonB-dependent receptor [Alteromonadaceae bacterium BrNp21-10]